MMRRLFVFFFGFLTVFSTFAEETDSLRTCSKAPSSHHFGYTLKVSPGKLIVMDEWQRRYQKHTRSTAFAIEANYTSLPQDKDDFAIDYNYPTLDFGLKFNLNDVTMHRATDEAWGMAEEVDYDSELGNIVTAYATFTRPIYRNNRWMFDYMLGSGIGYGKHKYSRGNNIDNELTGSRLLIYFTAGLHATYRFAEDWGITGGVEFYHHSNGALNRPNKGANIVGPVVGLRYMPYDKEFRSSGSSGVQGDSRSSGVQGSSGVQEFSQSEATSSFTRFQKRFYANITLGVGGKTLDEDWQLTQFRTPPDSPDYRTDKFNFYMAYSLQTDLMYRYARRWASGIGADLFYGTYADRVRDIENLHILTPSQSGEGASTISPWSVGIAAKHQAYYHNLSVAMSIGFYLYRHMGSYAKNSEQPYYERIGVHYTIPSLRNLTVGFNVKAHRLKADLTELVVSYPVDL